jgi:hypothetical protein
LEENPLGSDRRNIAWEKNSLVYKNIRVILAEEDFQRWRSLFIG